MSKKFIPLVIGGLLVVGLAAKWVSSDGYEVTMVLPNANNLFTGGSVVRDGYEAGTIKSIKVVDGKAQVRVKLDPSFDDLHDGATGQVVWKAALGERLLRIDDGPASNAKLPSGAMLRGVQIEPVEVDQVLAALDPPTRTKINSLIARLNSTMSGKEKDFNTTLETAGPALQQLGAVLRELGADGEAIKQLVVQFNDTMTILAKRDGSVASIVNDLSRTTATVVQQKQALGATLKQLPGVIDDAQTTLAKVPSTVDETVPLLDDLAPAMNRLTSVSKNLRPLLSDLRPAVADLRPTLNSLGDLLQITPGLLDAGTSTIPSVGAMFASLTPVLDFLRPYTPEVAGWASNWGSAAGNYDANGHYTRFLIQTGVEAPIGITGAPGPGVTQNFTPAPGSPVGQPWTDAYGSEMR